LNTTPHVANRSVLSEPAVMYRIDGVSQLAGQVKTLRREHASIEADLRAQLTEALATIDAMRDSGSLTSSALMVCCGFAYST